MNQREPPQLEPREGRCNAKLRNSRAGHAFCPTKPVFGRERCRMHGGTQKRGVEHPMWRGKGASVDLPTRLADRVKAHLNDPDLTSTLRDVALASSRVDELLAQFPTGEAGEAWLAAATAESALKAAVKDLDDTLTTEDVSPESARRAAVSIREGLAQLTAAISSGNQERALWGEIFDAQRHRAKLVETELKREERLEQAVTAKQAVALIGVLKQLMFEVVEEPAKRLYVAERLDRLIHKREPAPKALPRGPTADG